MSGCPACLNGCGGARRDCPQAAWAAPEPDKGGRPSSYSREVADAICRDLADGLALRVICRKPGMPPRSTVQGWVTDDVDGFAGRHNRARDMGLEELADEILDIADDGSNDWMERAGKDRTPGYQLNGEHVQRSRLRVDSRKWLLSKRLPKVYGDKVQHTGDGGGPVGFVVMGQPEAPDAEAWQSQHAPQTGG